MAASEFGTVEEIQAQLSEYEEQKKQVESLLLLDDENEEYNELLQTLEEAIGLLVDLLAETGVPQASSAEQSTALQVVAQEDGSAGPSMSLAGDANLSLTSILPASVAEQIRRAQIRAALSGTAPAVWAVGARCQAVYSADEQWYDATVESVNQDGKFVVVFDGYGNTEEVEAKCIRPPADTDEVYKGVAAPKRKRVEDEPVISEIPKWCEIRDADDDKTKSKKRKLLKSYKSKIRFQQMDMTQKKKQEDWKSFVKGKGKKKQAGFFTGRKKQSIFKVPEEVGGKVGVVGSGKGMTDYQQRSRHDFAGDL
ncbi:hypothetical protein BSKO_08088 [Bryopsis sp. KO-2023]|nr:hypothetical protein BSKO_08088 [Bryopsis sp. KO-2023]